MIYIIIVWNITSVFTDKTMIKTYITIITFIPVLTMFYTYLSEDSVYEFIYMIIKHVVSIKLYVYMLEEPSKKENIIVKIKLR